jgi:hypothetical protein
MAEIPVLSIARRIASARTAEFNEISPTILIAVVRKDLARDIHVMAYEATAHGDVKDDFAAPGHVNNETDE